MAWKSTFLLSSLVFFFSFVPLKGETLKPSNRNLEQVLVDEHSFFTVCGNFKYQRKRRSCQLHTDLESFRRCNNAERFRPLFMPSKKPQYQCFNTQNNGGKDIIRRILLSEDLGQQCLGKRVEQLHRQVISDGKFKSFFKKLKNQWGLMAKILYAFDTSNGQNTIQLVLQDLKDDPTSQLDFPLPIMLSSNNILEKTSQKCSLLQADVLFNKFKTIVNLHIASRNSFDPLEGHGKAENNIFDQERSPASPTKN